ncbi:hypothetical protein [Natronogracilivirga saccharolytica]|uniref:Uncharacterized protein n=1 Tax=Natronogracilivirga saccharolytica TaxID=2812953 RepID=A0A8J7RI62_9BACT|nr:hypothetical protein [Natronogracilivirga saccharolytica]MBP3191677.1 hypothetical protein [Natronogracilivirga saccharolytica]
MIRKWYYIPALLFLALTLVSGIWLRLQWAWPQWMLFRADYLIHGHSHVALLGWAFLGMMGLVLEAGTIRRTLPRRSVTGLGTLTVLVTFLLFVAFVREGYAPLSIALSTVHMLLGYGLAWIFFRNAVGDGHPGSQYFLEGAVFWMVMATAGIWLLAVGRGLPPFWVDASVQFYLHILFNGWFLFALCGLAFRYFIDPQYRHMTWPFWLMMVGLVPALIPQLPLQEPSYAVVLSGLAGSLLFAAGGLAVLGSTLRSLTGRWSYANKACFHGTGHQTRWICKELLWSGLIGAGPVFLLPVAMAWPPFREIWLHSDFLVIGYIHLHLLVVVSTLLLFGILQRLFKLQQTDRVLKTLHAGAWLYLTGSITMVILLFLTGIIQVTGKTVFFPVQKSLFYTGVISLTGILIIAGLLIGINIERFYHGSVKRKE